MPTLLETDADKLIRYRNWESNLLTALETPETVSAYGGMPDANANPVGVGRMPGRAQLLSELMQVRKLIDDLVTATDGAYEVTSEMTA